MSVRLYINLLCPSPLMSVCCSPALSPGNGCMLRFPTQMGNWTAPWAPCREASPTPRLLRYDMCAIVIEMARLPDYYICQVSLGALLLVSVFLHPLPPLSLSRVSYRLCCSKSVMEVLVHMKDRISYYLSGNL